MTLPPWARTRAERYSRQSESVFQFLDRVAGTFWDRVGALIDDWVAAYPEDHRQVQNRYGKKLDRPLVVALAAQREGN